MIAPASANVFLIIQIAIKFPPDDKLNVSKQIVSNWENNDIQPSIDTLIKIANFFNVSPDYLLGVEKTGSRVLDVSALTEEEIKDVKQIIYHICKNRVRE